MREISSFVLRAGKTMKCYRVQNPDQEFLSSLTVPFQWLAGLVNPEGPVEPILLDVAGMYFMIPAEALENCRDQEKARSTPNGPVIPAPVIDLSSCPSLDPQSAKHLIEQ
jgi:hypothetical protein